MLRLSFDKNPNTSEGGAVLVIGAFIIAALLAVVGLTIDAARLYFTKQQLQTVSVAATSAGARMLVLNPDVPYVEVEDRVRELIYENLERIGYTTQEFSDLITSICFGEDGTCGDSYPDDPSIDRRYIRATVTAKRKTLLLGLLPGFMDYTEVTAGALVENLKLRVVLVLDTSLSMRQLISDPPDGCTTKICALKYAVSEFLDTLLPFDEVGVIKFGDLISESEESEGDVSVSYIEGDGIAHRAYGVPRDFIDNWSAIRRNYSNDASALTGFPAMSRVISDAGEDQRPAIQAAVNAIEIDHHTQGFGTNIGIGIQRGHNMLMAGVGTPPPNTMHLIVLVTDGEPESFTPLVWQGMGERPFDDCTTDIYDAPAGLTKAEATERINRNRFVDAIIEADNAIMNGTKIFSVGIDSSEELSSPMMDVSELFQKELLLQRLANDQEKLSASEPTPTWTEPPVPEDYPRDYPCTISAGDSRIKGNPGKFLIANSGTQLRQAFQSIASIRTMVTE